MAQVPVQVTDGTRVHEPLQGAVKFTECPAKVAHQRERALGLGKRRAGQPADQAHSMLLTCGAGHGWQVVTRHTGPKVRHTQVRAMHGQMIEQRGLKLAFYPGLTGIDDFQYPARIDARIQPVIAVTLPVQGVAVAVTLKKSFARPSASLAENRGAGWERSVISSRSERANCFSIACHALPKPTPCIRSGSTGIMPVPTGIKTASLSGGAMRELDAKDREILEVLSKDARIALKALAGRIGLSRSATTERVANLERSGIIRGYRADIGEIDANVIRAILLVTLQRTPAMGLLDQLATDARVRRVSSVSGQLDLVVEVETRTIDDLNQVRDNVARHESVDDITTSVVLRRDIDRQGA